MGHEKDITRWNQSSAMLGGVAWVALATLSLTNRISLTIIELLFLLAPLVIAPLGLELVTSIDHRRRRRGLLWLGSIMQPFAATLAVASFFLPPGGAAAFISAGWLLVTFVVGLAGLRFPVTVFRSLTDACFDAGLLYLPVGGIWLVLTRMGATPLELGEPILLLTAVHFHYSGFALSLIAGAAGKWLIGEAQPHKIFSFVAIGVMGGTFLIAIGFLLSPALKVAAIGLFVANASALALFMLTRLSALRATLARRLLGVSAISLVVGMALALLYGIGEYTGDLLIGIPGMAELHGPLNGIGFTLCALLGWTVECRRRIKDRAHENAKTGVVVSLRESNQPGRLRVPHVSTQL